VGPNKSLAKTRARFNYLWRSGFTKILVQKHLQPGDFDHRLRPILLISGYDCSEDLGDAPSSVAVREKPKRRTRARATIGQVHALPLRRAGVELAPRRQARLDHRGNRLGRAARAKAAHEVGVPSRPHEASPVIAA
jgi:hypothetical protein